MSNMDTLQTTPQYEARMIALLIQVAKEQPFRDVILLGPGQTLLGYAVWTTEGHQYTKDKPTGSHRTAGLYGVYAMIG
jgi:hypothetical protein